MKVLCCLSGGLDSTTLLGYLIGEGHTVTCISFTYGSKHNKYENQAAKSVAAFYKVKLIELNISQVFEGIESSLLKSGGDIPEGHYEAESMKSTVVPARNMIFLSILAAIACDRKMEAVAVGIHAGDHAIYPDCRPEFINGIQSVIYNATAGQVSFLLAPFLSISKTAIVLSGFWQDTPVPFNLTRTCYKDQDTACGKCGSCIERLEAFKAAGMKDPIMYDIPLMETGLASKSITEDPND